MADVHYEVDETVKPGRDFMESVRALSQAWDKLTRLRGVLIQKKITGANDNTAYTQIVTQYGYSGDDQAGKEANAAASFAELDSAFGAGDAAITQFLNRHL